MHVAKMAVVPAKRRKRSDPGKDRFIGFFFAAVTG
jgi:hypothetical protein